jgi:MFS family permease
MGMGMMRATGHNRFFGWRVVGAAFVFAVFSWGICFYGASVFLHTLHATRGWSVALISAAITTHYLFGAGMVVFLDDAHRRFGIVRVTRAGVLALACGTLGWALAGAPWQLFAAAVLTALGWSATSSAAINAMLVPWFRRRRGFALSLAFNGASIGGVVFLPLWVALIARWGFPGAAAAVAAATVVVLWPLAGRYLRPGPGDLGQAPDGEVAPALARDAEATRPPLARRALLGERRFLTLSGAFALGLFSQVGLVSQYVALLAPTLGEGGAATAASLTTVAAVLGRLALGAIADRCDRRVIAAANFAMQAAGFLLLLTATGTAVVAGCILFGLGLGNLVSLPPLIAESEYEAVDVGRVVGLVVAVNQAFFSIAPGVFGALHDLAGGYRVPLLMAITLHLVAAAVVLAGRRGSQRTFLRRLAE